MANLRYIDYGLGSRSAGLFPLLGKGIFTQDGRPWRHSREVLRKQFARMQYQNLTVFNEHIENLLHELSLAPTGIVDLQPHFFRFTLSITTDLIFSEPVSTLGDDLQTSFGDSSDYVSLISAICVRLADLLRLYNTRKYKEVCAVVNRYADNFVSRALEVR